MYRVTTRQNTDGTFTTLDTADSYEAAVDSAKCEADGQPNGYAVYVFNEQTYMGKVYPYLVAKVTRSVGKYAADSLVESY